MVGLLGVLIESVLAIVAALSLALALFGFRTGGTSIVARLLLTDRRRRAFALSTIGIRMHGASRRLQGSRG
jgi:hypothetical protein